MRYGVWLLMFAEGTDANRQSMKCHQLPVLHGQYRTTRRRVGWCLFRHQPIAKWVQGQMKRDEVPCCSFAAQTLTKGRTSCYH